MTSLWRNREFTLLWTSQCLSDLGGAIAMLAVPLLVLEVTGSAVQAGAVGTAAQATKLICRLPAGVLADRVNRRRAMLICDVVRLIAFTGLAVAVVLGRATLGTIIVVAVIDAVGGSLFNTTEHASLRSIVPPAQLPAAVARNEARSYATSLAGPPVGGLLFGLGQALPFLGNAVSYLASLIGVAMIRKPLQTARPDNPPRHTKALAEGIRFVFGNPFLRAVLLIAAPLNFALYGSIFTIVVTLQSHRVAPGVIGLTETIVSAGGLIGALAAPALLRRLSFPALIRGLGWAATLFLAVSALLTMSVAAAVPVALAIFVGPACNAALFGYQAAITPDHLQGRVLSVIFLVAMSAAAAAPLLAGVFVTLWSPTISILLFSAAVSASALTATFSPAIRTMRPLEEPVTA
ncbi:MFS transporter [Paractinoplanes brasiliensis]|uniref:Putative MFS family arabinose efflux permease n=1 Tax=Paractinoplanes brasiliensis TaxID=52695 RepID=A0A4R6JMQ4_9ACTN|nr:MFS transporter [Actinoplanes brasiliensis]TDO37664.1 putative MFS family arabinose efflux permease [Actinoplanes brasiliensis]GID31766.1 MFS transporter [Actinoplanes brasiliensis]